MSTEKEKAEVVRKLLVTKWVLQGKIQSVEGIDRSDIVIWLVTGNREFARVELEFFSLTKEEQHSIVRSFALCEFGIEHASLMPTPVMLKIMQRRG